MNAQVLLLHDEIEQEKFPLSYHESIKETDTLLHMGSVSNGSAPLVRVRLSGQCAPGVGSPRTG
jgi:hypothetical protein